MDKTCLKLAVDVGEKGVEKKETAYSFLLGSHFPSVAWCGGLELGVSTIETRKCLLLIEEQE